MEIIRGSLDDISRPASSDQTSSRASSLALPHSDRMGRITPFSLVVLTKDDADIESRSEGTTTASSARGPDKIQDPVKVGDERNEDSRLRRAMDEMRRLDEILSAKICTEKQVKRQRKELQAKLWQEFLQNKPEGHSEGAQETMNTRLFWALEASTGIEDEDDFVPLFETQVPDCDKKSDGWMESSEVRGGDAGGEQLEGSLCGASPSRKKQKDFVKRNIELVIGEGDQVVLTRGEKEHLAELLEGVDGGDEDGAGDADSQGRGSEAGWKCYGDLQPGETVLQDIKERRGQERRLHEIQQQLEMLNQGQEMTDVFSMSVLAKHGRWSFRLSRKLSRTARQT
uniref:Fibrous sheath-interacting protein 1 n=1 Tax=Gasterosteus aculeatus aculeatus TaxID=481459 RepID=A0AAQ4P897_GASAC